MAEGIFLQRDGSLVDMQPSGYVTEDELQALLEQHAVLLGGEQMSDGGVPRRFLLIRREASIPDAPDTSGRWSVDHVFIDQDAVPTLVEVKRSENTQIRREIVGQMLDYAANAVVHWPVGTLQEHFAATHAAAGPREVLSEFLQLDDEPVDEIDEVLDAWWAQAEANLRSGRLRLLFVADRIPRELRRIVEFLNEQMTRTDVLAVEIRNFVGDDLRALVPRVVGLTEAARESKRRTTSQRRPLSEVWADAPAAVTECRTLMDGWAVQRGIESTDLDRSRRYRWPTGRALAYLYPGQPYRSIYLSLAALEDEAVEARIHAAVTDLRGGATVGRKEPGMPCSIVVDNWARFVSEVLDPLATALQPSSG